MASRPPPHLDPASFSSVPSGFQSSSDRRGDISSHHGSFIDAAASIAAAEVLNKRNAHANSAVDIAASSNSPYPPTFTSAPTALDHLDYSMNVTSMSDASHRLSSSPVQFRSHTIAPSPPLPHPPRASSPSPTSSTQGPSPISSYAPRSPYQPSQLGGTALRLQTEFRAPSYQNSEILNGFTTPHKTAKRPNLSLHHKTSASSLHPLSRTPSLKTGGLSGAFGSASAASSTVASPVISAMGDVTPLPSPLLSSHSPGPWKKLGRHLSPETPTFSSATIDNALGAHPGDESHTATPTRVVKKSYGGLTSGHAPTGAPGGSQDVEHLPKPQSHTRNRSISEYKPDPMLIPKRMSTVSGTRVKGDVSNLSDGHMRREPHLSESRGLTPVEKPPTPPPSESSLSAADSSSVRGSDISTGGKQQPPPAEYFEAYGRYDRKRRRWLAVKMLGQGTFSRVVLATSQVSSSLSDDEDSPNGGFPTTDPPTKLERSSLVAVKICEHGPLGGASEDRIEMSLKRELEIMRAIRHPSLVNLKAWSIEPSRAILVLSYYPGGDLFDVASRHRNLLRPSLLRRIFAELVGAVSYLHDQRIVHRDIKLENVMVNLTPAELQTTSTDWMTYPYSVITLGDLGLSRHVADDEKLETRCGSDDYAAPEVIMGQPYDGRAIDAWSLGVLLYALLEGRLPFDPPPGVGDYAMQMRMRSRTSHRIARVEWRWIEFGAAEGEDGEGDHEADFAKFDAKGLRGAMEVVEGLLKRARSRWPLTKVAQMEWVSDAIQIAGGIKFREEEEGEEVL
ncbi:kinase-like domain-containing protein [Podospora australis]|uniref:Kinase-like domain-containing protein n=1 Tax=Podospora australis TaxID=1536484 RepID=A0AAN6WVQ1_9PEZI|nr:kinase-like domain-containing protein [Podospora australis]